jgi:hypothetical protein
MGTRNWFDIALRRNRSEDADRWIERHERELLHVFETMVSEANDLGLPLFNEGGFAAFCDAARSNSNTGEVPNTREEEDDAENAQG